MTEFNRRELLLKGSSAAAAAAAAYALRGPASTLLPGNARAATTTAWNHDPGSPIGPYHWAEIDPGFSVCGSGMHQSPVDIETAHVGVVHGPPLLLRYDASEFAIENTGHVVEVPIPPGVEDVLQIGGTATTSPSTTSTPPQNTPSTGVTPTWKGTSSIPTPRVRRPWSACSTASAEAKSAARKILLKAPETSGEEGSPLGEANPAELFRAWTERAPSTARSMSTGSTPTAVR